jgi:hypothetical protein
MEGFVLACENALQQSPKLLQYFLDRGFTNETIKARRWGWCDPALLPAPNEVHDELKLSSNGGWELSGRLTIPYIEDGIVLSVRGRQHPDYTHGQKYMSLPGATSHPYIPTAIDPTQPVVIVEGEFDAALLRQNGIQSVGCPGAQNARKEWFRGFHYPYIAFDGDEGGRNGALTLLKQLTEARRIDMPEGYDVSDYIQAFGIGSFTTLMGKAVYYLHGKPQKDDKLSTVVEDFANWSWTSDARLGPQMKWAPQLDKAMSGLAPGLTLIGALPNTGKSCFQVKMAMHCAIENRADTVVVYLSLDDSTEETMTRMLALLTGLPFYEVRSPRVHIAPYQNKLALYNKCLEDLKKLDNLILRDATYGRELPYVRSLMESVHTKYPEKRMVIFIDSLSKITPGSDDADITLSGRTKWKSFLAAELKFLSTKYRASIITPADFRKLNGERPVNDSLGDAVELQYESNFIMLGYSDLNDNDASALKWFSPTDNTYYPVLEFNISKNKFTNFRGKIQYNFHPPTSNFEERPEGSLIR